MVRHTAFSSLRFSGGCQLRLWLFVCKQGLRTLYHNNAQVEPVQNTAVTTEGTAGKLAHLVVGMFGPQPMASKLDLSKSWGELLPWPEKSRDATLLQDCLRNLLINSGQREVYHEQRPPIVGTPCRTSVVRSPEGIC